MQCPIDHIELVITTREGIEIDYCPKCRGIWLDRGELDKLIERGNAYEKTHYAHPVEDDYEKAKRGYTYDDDDDDYPQQNRSPYKKKKKSFLGDMFDIFD